MFQPLSLGLFFKYCGIYAFIQLSNKQHMQNCCQKNTNSTQMNILEIKEHLKAKRRSKRAQIKESFYCQCGRVYLSFSALYLHAKIKHDLKLTTKKDSSLFHVENVDGFLKFVYSISNSKQKNQQERIESQIKHEDDDRSSKLEDFDGIPLIIQNDKLNFYITSIESQQERKIIKQFINYAINQTNSNVQTDIQKIQRLPDFLNSFLIDFLPKTQEFDVNTCQGNQACIYLYNFCEWLQSNKLTDFLVMYNYC